MHDVVDRCDDIEYSGGSFQFISYGLRCSKLELSFNNNNNNNCKKMFAKENMRSDENINGNNP